MTSPSELTLDSGQKRMLVFIATVIAATLKARPEFLEREIDELSCLASVGAIGAMQKECVAGREPWDDDRYEALYEFAEKIASETDLDSPPSSLLVT